LVVRLATSAGVYNGPHGAPPAVLKWLLTTAIALVILTAVSPLLARYGLGRLPGDITVRWRGRDWYLPFTTTLLMSVALTILAKLL
jgi:hypothetical protein